MIIIMEMKISVVECQWFFIRSFYFWVNCWRTIKELWVIRKRIVGNTLMQILEPAWLEKIMKAIFGHCMINRVIFLQIHAKVSHCGIYRHLYIRGWHFVETSKIDSGPVVRCDKETLHLLTFLTNLRNRWYWSLTGIKFSIWISSWFYIR